MTSAALDDGWDDFDVDDGDFVDKGQPTTTSAVKVKDGWDDNDEFFDDSGDDVALNEEETKPVASVQQQHQSLVAGPPQVSPSDSTTNDWGEEDIDIDDGEEEKDIQTSLQTASIRKAPPQSQPPVGVPVAATMSPSKTYQDLESYLHLLPHLNASVNAVLESEYNTTQKALEVLEYFTQRPGLVDYTIEKELPRMDYVVIEDSGMPLHDKDSIAAWMVQAGGQGSLLPRCANQSLLADLLQAMTGPDMLIRPQFLATAIATSCDFCLDAPEDSVLVKASLELTIPTEHGRWKVADLNVFCQFNVSSSPPRILYRVDVVKPTPRNNAWHAELASAARLIESMELPEESFMNVSYQQSSKDGMHYRDEFLQQSQTLLQNSAVGLRSALKEIDAVAGISSKLSKLPGFLPDDVMEAAERAHVVEQRPQVQGDSQHRPTSILGGFLSSGLSRLAQTVNLPEEDPEYYQNWQQQQQQPTQGHPSLFNRQQPETALPRLYNREAPRPAEGRQFQNNGNNPQKPEPAMPRLYNRDAPPVGKRQAQKYPPGITPTPQVYRNQPNAQHSAIPSGSLSSNGASGMQPAKADNISSLSTMKPLAEPETGDGWDMEDDDIFSPDELATLENKSPWGQELSSQAQAEVPTNSTQQEIVDEDWVYDPETDIIPTRKRWVNPRPFPRTLEYFMTGH